MYSTCSLTIFFFCIFSLIWIKEKTLICDFHLFSQLQYFWFAQLQCQYPRQRHTSGTTQESVRFGNKIRRQGLRQGFRLVTSPTTQSGAKSRCDARFISQTLHKLAIEGSASRNWGQGVTAASSSGPLLFRTQCRLLRAKPTTSRPQVGAALTTSVVARQRHPRRQRDISAVELRQLGAERLHVLDVGIS